MVRLTLLALALLAFSDVAPRCGSRPPRPRPPDVDAAVTVTVTPVTPAPSASKAAPEPIDAYLTPAPDMAGMCSGGPFPRPFHASTVSPEMLRVVAAGGMPTTAQGATSLGAQCFAPGPHTAFNGAMWCCR